MLPGSETAPVGDLIGQFLDVQRRARQARTGAELGFVMVNETRRLFPCRQIILAQSPFFGEARVIAASAVTSLDRSAPFVLWIEELLSGLFAAQAADPARPIGPLAVLPDQIAPGLRPAWNDWGASHVLWWPLATRDREVMGGLWLTREQPWRREEILLLGELVDVYAHAWSALERVKPKRKSLWRHAWIPALIVVVGFALGLIQVRRSVLAPAEITARQPEVVAAPMDGVIKSFHVSPGQSVGVGALLFTLDDTTARGRVEVARRMVDVAWAEHHRAAQNAFVDRRSGTEVAGLEAQARAREAELSHAERLLEQTRVMSRRAGLALFADPEDWIGRPVSTGERVLQIADPGRVEVRVLAPVEDGLAVATGALMQVFLDADPLRPLSARVIRAAHEAEVTPQAALAYRVIGDLLMGEEAPPRIGMRGVATIYGQDESLFLHLFRRPLVGLRRSVDF